MKTLRREKSILSAGEAVDPHQSLCHRPLSSISWCSQNQLIYVHKISHPSLPNCPANFRICHVFSGKNICLCTEELHESVIKANNNDQYIWVSIMYHAYAKHATKSQGIMKHFRRLRLTEVKWFAEVH